MDVSDRQELHLTATQESLYTVLGALEEQLDRAHCPADKKTQLLIAAEEMYINIVHYAYEGKAGEAVVEMEVTPEPKVCRVVLRDRGKPYNPLEKKDPDITLPADKREIGGLGIYMVKNSMDRVGYIYENGYNVFTMEKRLT